jgi:hypothetical protein
MKSNSLTRIVLEVVPAAVAGALSTFFIYSPWYLACCQYGLGDLLILPAWFISVVVRGGDVHGGGNPIAFFVGFTLEFWIAWKALRYVVRRLFRLEEDSTDT